MQFAEEYQIKDTETSLRICERVIQVETREEGVSWFEAMEEGWDEASGDPWTGKQTVFVSHAWCASFKELLNTLTAFEVVHGAGQYFFIDLFSLNQHDVAALKLQTPEMKAKIADQLLDSLDAALVMADTVLVA